LILQNPDDRDLFLEHTLMKDERIYLIRGSGVDTDFFAPVQRKRSTHFRVLLASRLLWEKGIREYVEAAALLTHRSETIEFLLAGDADPGNPTSVPQAEIRQWQAAGLVKVLGHVKDIRQLLDKVDLMVLPSYREGTPRGLLEAASTMLPLITTDAPGCREIVEDGINGLLVPVGDASTLEKIEYLLDNPKICDTFGRAGREKVLQEFDQEMVFQQTWAVYQSLGMGR
ncbi:MAG: glycosyltransferase family 1 protein, partial [Candidatus Electrothrix sp. AR3]|nr:glycosyltransferase family 1 protein [Candidatus Electrothrix sp. AR3]